MILVDATTLIALGKIGELDLLLCFDDQLCIPLEVASEVTTEPANTNLERLRSSDVVNEDFVGSAETATQKAQEILGETELNGDVAIISRVLVLTGTLGNLNVRASVVSADRRVRTVARGLGATVTGTIGVIVRAVEDQGMTADEGRDLVRRVDGHGLHMTGELREKAYELVEDAAND